MTKDNTQIPIGPISNAAVSILSIMLYGSPRCTRFDGEFELLGHKYKYSAYLIRPKVGTPTVRVDIKEVK